jgi:hypothetical protein
MTYFIFIRFLYDVYLLFVKNFCETCPFLDYYIKLYGKP